MRLMLVNIRYIYCIQALWIKNWFQIIHINTVLPLFIILDVSSTGSHMVPSGAMPGDAMTRPQLSIVSDLFVSCSSADNPRV